MNGHNSEIEQQVDWMAAPMPRSTRTTGNTAPGRVTRAKAAVPATRRDVMETLLGRHSLAAVDVSGSDPYNATGRHMRR